MNEINTLDIVGQEEAKCNTDVDNVESAFLVADFFKNFRLTFWEIVFLYNSLDELLFIAWITVKSKTDPLESFCSWRGKISYTIKDPLHLSVESRNR